MSPPQVPPVSLYPADFETSFPTVSPNSPPFPSPIPLSHTTKRISLIPLSAEHIPDLWKNVAGADKYMLYKYMPFGPFSTIEEFTTYITWLVQHSESGFVNWAIVFTEWRGEAPEAKEDFDREARLRAIVRIWDRDAKLRQGKEGNWRRIGKRGYLFKQLHETVVNDGKVERVCLTRSQRCTEYRKTVFVHVQHHFDTIFHLVVVSLCFEEARCSPKAFYIVLSTIPFSLDPGILYCFRTVEIEMPMQCQPPIGIIHFPRSSHGFVSYKSS
ncbi:hypothetical protein EYC80_009104 [Monilinia laxa]|uniref:N-acetyltransferase domain-containing protein n=1 Tax=Monilinia laxa TaxID=61186 RepID=A0A5N6K2X0_MONLA|nr:hypothetical protein EYC80_009104 [Monilinia laxa]